MGKQETADRQWTISTKYFCYFFAAVWFILAITSTDTKKSIIGLAVVLFTIILAESLRRRTKKPVNI